MKLLITIAGLLLAGKAQAQIMPPPPPPAGPEGYYHLVILGTLACLCFLINLKLQKSYEEEKI